MVVEDVMTADPITVEVTASIRKVLNLMFEQDIRHLPVVEAGELAGIVSDRDLRGFLAPAMVDLESARDVQSRLSRPISTVMNKDVLSVTPETDLTEVIDIMIEQRVGAVPVVTPGTQDLVGIVSYVDVLRAARDRVED